MLDAMLKLLKHNRIVSNLVRWMRRPSIKKTLVNPSFETNVISSNRHDLL